MPRMIDDQRCRGILPVLRQPLAYRLWRGAGLVLQIRSTPGGGGGIGKPNILFNSHLPRRTGDVRSG